MNLLRKISHRHCVWAWVLFIVLSVLPFNRASSQKKDSQSIQKDAAPQDGSTAKGEGNVPDAHPCGPPHAESEEAAPAPRVYKAAHPIHEDIPAMTGEPVPSSVLGTRYCLLFNGQVEDMLNGKQALPDGYGLYSFIIFNNRIPDDNFKKRARRILHEILSTVPEASSNEPQKSTLNILFVPLDENEDAVTIEERSSYDFIEGHYSYDKSSKLYNKILESARSMANNTNGFWRRHKIRKNIEKLASQKILIVTVKNANWSSRTDYSEMLIWGLDDITNEQEVTRRVNNYLAQVTRPRWDQAPDDSQLMLFFETAGTVVVVLKNTIGLGTPTK
jgi:hypothetical protein